MKAYNWLMGVQWQCYCVRMEDDSCVMKYIEIVPRDDNSNVTDTKCEPLSVKVGVVSSFYLIYVI